MNKTVIIAASVLAVIVAGGVGYKIVSSQAQPSPAPIVERPKVIVNGEEVTADDTMKQPGVTAEMVEKAMLESLTKENPNMADAPASKSYGFDGDATDALSIGDADAPLTMVEYSSLSCPHCAFFHRNTLPELTKNYVDTGKLRIVFQDFPLNRKAFDATMILRCMPSDQRYSFMNLLFSTMNDWLAADDHLQALSQYASIQGADNEKLSECMNRPEVAESVIEGAKKASDKYKINATPSFRMPDGSTLSGSVPYSEVSKILDAELAQ